jgi:LAO/AO transport system kinase
MKAKGYFTKNRENQASFWLRETISESLIKHFQSNPLVKKRLAALEIEIKNQHISPFTAARELIELFLKA